MPYNNFVTPKSKYFYEDILIEEGDFNKYQDAFGKLRDFMNGEVFGQFENDHPEEAGKIRDIYRDLEFSTERIGRIYGTLSSKSGVRQNLYDNAERMRKILNILDPYEFTFVEGTKKKSPVYKGFLDFNIEIDRFYANASKAAREKKIEEIRGNLGLGEDDGSPYVAGQLAKEVKADILYYTTPEEDGFKEMLDHFHSLKTTEEKMKMLYGCAIAMETKPDTSLSKGETNAYHVMFREVATPLKKDGTLDEAQREANIRALVKLSCEATIKLGTDEESLALSYEAQGKSKKAAYALANQTSPWTIESVAGQQLISNIQSDPIGTQGSGDFGVGTAQMVDRVTKQVLDERAEAEYAKVQQAGVVQEKEAYKENMKKLFNLGLTVEKLSDTQLGLDKAARAEIDASAGKNSVFSAIRNFEPAWRPGGVNAYRSEAVSELELPGNKLEVSLYDVGKLAKMLRDTDRFFYINSSSYKQLLSSVERLYSEGNRLTEKAEGISKDDVEEYHMLLNETVRNASQYALDNMNAGSMFNGKKRLDIALTILNITNPNAARQVAGIIETKTAGVKKVNLDELTRQAGVGESRPHKNLRVYRQRENQPENQNQRGLNQ